MLVNEYGIRKIKFELKITMLRLRNKPEDDMTGMWGGGNITICKLEDQKFSP